VTENRTLLLRTVLLWLLLELLAATQIRSPAGTPVAWDWLRTAISPFIWTAQQLGELTTDLVFGLRSTQRLLAENQALRSELQETRSRIVLLEEDRAAMREASALLDSIDGFDSSSITGRCVYRNLRLGRMELLIAAPHTIVRDSPVVAAAGLVGRVVDTAHRRCWVELLTHPAAAVAVQTADGSVHGLATGSGISELTVEYVPRAAALLRGDLLLTSGADGIYPPGIPVAQVSRIRESDASFLEVAAAPRVDVATLRVVLLLPEWRPEIRERGQR
jgi:rod shape-determining protein MreC